MDIRSLSNDALKEIVHSLLEKGEARAIIDSHPLLAANVPYLEDARAAFAQLLPSAIDRDSLAAIEAKLAANADEIEREDATFDHSARAAHGLLSIAAEVTANEARAAKIVALGEKLFPRGLTIVNLSAAEESGTARSLDESLSSDDESALAKIKLEVAGEKFTALSLIRAQITAGRALGKLAAKREALLAQKADVESPADQTASERSAALGRYSRARTAIVRAIADFYNDVQRAQKLDAVKKQSLLGTIERLATRKRTPKKPPSEGPDTESDPVT